MNDRETVFCHNNDFLCFDFHYIKINKECKSNSVLMDGVRL